MTSSTINFFKRPLFWGLLFFLGCSQLSEKKSKKETSIEICEDLEASASKVDTLKLGPTSKTPGIFMDKTKEYGLENYFAVAMNAVDLNFDGLTDLAILPSFYTRPKFLLFDPIKKAFVPWSHDPLPLDFKASYILIYDMNKDRIPDLLAGVLNQRSEISQIPIKFYLGSVKDGLLSFVENKDALTLIPEPTSSISILDYDLDGWPDLFVANWFENKEGQYYPVADRLFHNVDGKFVEETILLRSEADKTSDQVYPPNAKPTYGSSTCDIDRNGYPDIMTVSSSGHKNKLWMNLREPSTDIRHFVDIGPHTNYASDPDGSLIPTGGGRSFFSACTDYNDDGIMDVFVGELSHAYDNDSVDRSSILTGSRATYPPYFQRTEYVSDSTSASWNQGDRRGIWLDYNLDGHIDMVVDNSGFPPYSRLVLFEQDGSHAFTNVGALAGIDIVNPAATISIDLNKDGLPDLITSQNNIRRANIEPRLYVFENHLKGKKRKAIRVHLNGIKSNTQGLGAMVMLHTQNKKKKTVQTRWVEYSQGGLPSQNESGVLFGVGEGEAVGLKVRWPYLKKRGFGTGEVLEVFYSLKRLPKKDYLEITVCEDGKIMAGKLSCQ